MNYFTKYLRIINQELKITPGKFTKIQILSYYFKWIASLLFKEELLNNPLPWINFPAIDFLKKIAHEKMVIFEYGSGSSTLFWARRVHQVYSVEHDNEWATNVKEKLMKDDLKNVQIIQISPTRDLNFAHKRIENPDDYISNDTSFKEYNFEKYVKTIDKYPENYFDMVIIDGRARPSCLLNARTKVKPSGYLLIDNTERDYYLKKILPILQKEQWKQYDFYGPVPSLTYFCQTTVFQKSV